MTKELDLEFIKQVQKELILLSQANALLSWDMEVYLPKKGFESRAEQKAFLGKLIHEKILDDRIIQTLEKLKKVDLGGDDNIIVERFYNDVLRARKIPSEFVEKIEKVTAKAFEAWQEAREKDNFKIFEPHLKEIVELKRKEADYICVEGHKYNSLLDDYEKGMRVELLKPIFEKLKKDLIILINKIKDSEVYKNQKRKISKNSFPKEAQMELVRDVAKRIGLNDEFSRIDFAEHPFTIGISSKDVRITTNVREDPFFAFHSTMHEAGHGLYESNFPLEHSYNVLSNSPSMGIHESQSIFWENMVGKSKPFLEFYFEKFDKHLRVGDFEKLYQEVNYVEPSKIRIESDEVFYCLHIIMRFEIEMGLIDGSIEVTELPGLWNRKMKEYFGLEIENDKEGVLQDVHWSEGYFGYFPTYALGTIYSSQVYEAMKKEFPDLESQIRSGDFSKIAGWLKEKIHLHGRKFLAEDLIKNICGEGLNPDVYTKYLKEKYSHIYKFN